MLKKLKPESEFSRNTLSLITGSTISQAIPAALSPILTRIYTPEDYGLFAIYASVTAIFATLATARYDNAILIPKSDKEAMNVVFLSLFMTVIITLISLLIVFFFNKEIVSFIDKPEISPWLYFIPFSVFLSGIYQALMMWTTRKKRFKRVSANMVLNTGVGSGSSLSFGLYGFGVIGLIYATFIAQVAIVFHLIFKSSRNDKFLFKYVNQSKMIQAMKKYKKMPLMMMPSTLIDNVRIASLNGLIISFFTTAILGQMSLAFRIIRTPMTVVGSSIIQVFMQKLAITEKKDYYNLLKKYFLKTSIISFPIYLFFYLFSVELFSFVFGENWRMAGEIGSILSIWMFFHVMTVSMGHFLMLVHRQEVTLIFSIIYLIIPFLIFMVFNNGIFLDTFFIMAVVMSGINLAYILYGLWYARKLRDEQCFLLYNNRK